MAKVPGLILTGVTFCAAFFFSFSHSKASDANVAIVANFDYFAKTSLAPLYNLTYLGLTKTYLNIKLSVCIIVSRCLIEIDQIIKKWY